MLRTDQECSHARASWDGGRGWFADQSSGCTGDTWRVSPCYGCCERGVEDWMRCWMSGHSIYTCQRRTEACGCWLKEQQSGIVSRDWPSIRDEDMVHSDFIIHLLRWARHFLRLILFVKKNTWIFKKEPIGFRRFYVEHNLDNLSVIGIMGRQCKWAAEFDEVSQSQWKNI